MKKVLMSNFQKKSLKLYKKNFNANYLDQLKHTFFEPKT